MQNLSCDNEFYFHENKKRHFHINGFTLSFALKQRLAANSGMACYVVQNLSMGPDYMSPRGPIFWAGLIC